MNKENKTIQIDEDNASEEITGKRLFPLFVARICMDLVDSFPEEIDLDLKSRYIDSAERNRLPYLYHKSTEGGREVNYANDKQTVTMLTYLDPDVDDERVHAARKRMQISDDHEKMKRIVRGTMLVLIEKGIVQVPNDLENEIVDDFRMDVSEFTLRNCRLNPDTYDELISENPLKVKEIYDKYAVGKISDAGQQTPSNFAGLLKLAIGGVGCAVKGGASKAFEDLVKTALLAASPVIGSALAIVKSAIFGG